MKAAINPVLEKIMDTNPRGRHLFTQILVKQATKEDATEFSSIWRETEAGMTYLEKNPVVSNFYGEMLEWGFTCGVAFVWWLMFVSIVKHS